MKYKVLGIIFIVAVATAVVSGIYYWQMASQLVPPMPVHQDAKAYTNNQYGFTIQLTDSWKGYSVINSLWEGRDVTSGQVTESGPLITLRHPLWTTANQREDMPVMVFIPAQWSQVLAGKLAVGAAPIPPSLLGQNSKYIIALPARYNYDYKTGWEEVDQLVHKLRVFELPLVATGTIEGSLSYPSEGLPAMKVCALNMDSNAQFCTQERINDKKYKYGLGYRLDVPVGKYQVYASLLSSLGTLSNNYRAYFSEFVKCGGNVYLCLSHKPISLDVKSNADLFDISPSDWENSN